MVALRVRYWLCLATICLLPGCGGSSDPDAPEAARWVLQKGGKLSVAGKSLEVTSLGQIPSDPFAIVKIDLNGIPIKDKELSNLKELKSLHALGLYRSGITDKGLDHLKDLTTLVELELSQTKITDKGLDKLAGLNNLGTLYVRGTLVTQAAADKLQKEITGLKIYRD